MHGGAYRGAVCRGSACRGRGWKVAGCCVHEGHSREFLVAAIMPAWDIAAPARVPPSARLVCECDRVCVCMQSEDYVHRIGRTGRAGAAGRSLALVHRRNDSECAEYLVKVGPGGRWGCAEGRLGMWRKGAVHVSNKEERLFVVYSSGTRSVGWSN